RHGGERTTVGKLLDDLNEHAMPPEQARKELAATGLGLEWAHEIPGAGLAGYVLAIPNSSPLVAEMFDGTPWHGTPGAGGPWKDALRQAPPEIVITDRTVNRRYIGGVQQRCALVILAKFELASER